MVLRAVCAFFLLMLAGLNGMLAGAVETCTQNAPDSLFAFIFTLPLNLIGIALLCWKPHRLAVILTALLPAALAVRYSIIALELASGTPACTIITGSTTWEPSGDEAALAIGWAACALIFWIGLAYALSGGYRPRHDRNAEHFD